MHAPTESHWVDVKRILRYVKGTASFGLNLTRSSSLSLHGFTGDDWAGSIDDRKSTGFFMALLPFHGNLASNALLLALPQKQNIRH
jgi:histone deacetylase 1/2